MNAMKKVVMGLICMAVGAAGAGTFVLPREYQLVTHVTVTKGTNNRNAVMTGIKWKDVRKLHVKYATTDTKTTHFMMFAGYATSSLPGALAPWISLDNPHTLYPSGVTTSNLVLTDGDGYARDGSEHELTFSVSCTSDTLLCFGAAWSDSNWSITADWMFVEILGADDEPLGVYYPCTRKADGVAGFYDSVSKEFYTKGVASWADFIAGDTVSQDVVFVKGEPEECGRPDPDYGLQESLVAGRSYTYTAPACWTNDAKDTTAECLGWKLVTDDGTVKKTGTNASATFEYAEDLAAGSLIWLWNVHRVAALGTPAVESVMGGASVSVNVPGIGLDEASAELEVWSGLSPDLLSKTATRTITMAGDYTLSFGKLTPGGAYVAKVRLVSGGQTVDSPVVNFLCEKLPEAQIVPGYSRMVYLESHKKERIDTGIPASINTSVEMHFGEVNYASMTALFGEAWAGSAYLFNMQGSTQFYFHGAGTVLSTVKGGIDYYMSTESTGTENGKIRLAEEGGGVTNVWSVSLKGNGSKLNLFANPNGGNASAYRMYDMKIWESGELVRDYIPCWGEAEKTGGLYDRVGKLFYPSANASAPFAREAAAEVFDVNASLERGTDGVVTRVMAGADVAASDLYRVSGLAYGGYDVAAWTTCEQVGAITASARALTIPVPQGWGETSTMTRFFAVDASGGTNWSQTVFWKDFDAPILGDLTLDGTGGDTLVVKGNLEAFGGSSCELKVLVGKSADALDQVWAGLAGAIRTKAGAYEFTLFEDEVTASKYLEPGETYCVAVEARAGSSVSRSGMAMVTMSKELTFGATSGAISRRSLTASGSVSDLGMSGESEVTLWVGEGGSEDQLVQVEDPVVMSARGAFSIVHTFPQFDTVYYWQLRAKNTAVGGTSSCEIRTPVTACTTVDNATYTWSGGARGNWNDPANWKDNQNGDAYPYPQTKTSYAKFPAGEKVTVVLDGEITVASLDFTGANNSEITFENAGESTNENQLVCNAVSVDATFASCEWTLDGVAVRCTGGANPGRNMRIVLKNGSDLYFAGDVWNQKSGWIELYDHSVFSANQFGIGSDGTAPGGMILDDSTFVSRSHFLVGMNKPGAVLRFQGKNPVLLMTNAAGNFRVNIANADAHVEFLVPAGGFDAPVIRCGKAMSYVMGNNNAAAALDSIAFDILDESPANRVDDEVLSPLVAWNKGISRTMIREGALPDDGNGTDDAFVWSEEADPQTLGVRIVGSTHGNALTVSSAPEVFAADRVSPAYGIHEGLAAQVLTAPSDVIQVSTAKRTTCSGWKLYRIDPTTRERTLVDSGTESSYSFTNGDGAWYDFEWQWKVEYLVTAVSSGHGSVTVENEWVENGKLAKVTPAADEGYAFGKWTGDVPAEHDKDQSLAFVVRDRGYAFTASFLPMTYVDGVGGSDSNGGTSWGDAYATVAAALAKRPNTCIVLADGVYEVTEQIAIASGTTVAGANPGAKAVVKFMKAAPAADARGSVFKLSHADARLYNLAITTDYDKGDVTKNAYGAQRNLDFARGVYIDGAGLIDSCVITNCRTLYGGNGGGVYMNGGGVVRNSTLSGNTTYSSGGNNAQGHNVYMTGGIVESCELTHGGIGGNASSTAGLAMYGGIVRNSLIANNTTGHDGVSNSTGVYFCNPGGTLENCTIAGNYHNASSVAPGISLYTGTAKLRNCIVWDNVNTGGTLNWYNFAGTYDVTCTCAMPAFKGEGNIDSDPAFVSPAQENYRLGLSGAVDSGEWSAWMDWTTDLDGNFRVQGKAVDMGCYEFVSTGISCGFDVATTGALGTDEITLASRVLGDDLDGLVFTWTLVDQDGRTTTTNGSDLATLRIPMPVGSYTVTLKVENGAGASASATKPDVFTVSASDIYVSLEGKGVYPYASYEDGATMIADAIAAAADGTVIHVDEGSYWQPDTLNITKGVKIVAEKGRDKTFIRGKAQTTNAPLIAPSHPDLVLSGFTVTGTDDDGKAFERWGAFRMTGGTVTNCCICDHQTYSISVQGAAFRLEGGTIVDCLITNCWTKCSGGAGYNGVIYQTGEGSLVDRCVIVGNNVGSGGASYGGGVYLNKGVLRNSLVIGNSCATYGGGVTVDGSGQVLNCTVVGNSAGTQGGGIYVRAATAVVKDCLLYNNKANGTPEDTDDPGFVDAANGDYHLDVASAAVDASVTDGIGDYDLDRKPRVIGRKSAAIKRADKGCYEYDFSKFAIGIGFTKLTKFAPGKVELKADSTDDLDQEACWWTFDGSEPTAENHAAVGACVTNVFGYGAQRIRFKTVYDGETYAFDKPDWFTMYGETVHLVQDNPNALFPYATRETAATNLYEAMTAVQEGATLLVDDGSYQVKTDYDLTLAYPVTIRSVNGPEKTILFGNAENGTYSRRPFVLDHKEATIAGFTLLRCIGGSGGALKMSSGGTVSNCVFQSCGCKTPNGGAICAYGESTIVDCVFDDCFVCNDTRLSGGVAIYANGKDVLIDRCLVRNCTDGPRPNLKNNAPGDGAIYLESNNVTGFRRVRNTVVVGNVLQGCAGIVAGKNSEVENCTVIGNVSTGATEQVVGVRVTDPTARVVNTVVYGNRWQDKASEKSGDLECFDTCLVGIDPKLRGKGKWAYRPTSASPCLDAGRVRSWMPGATDVYGQPRVQGVGAVKKPDIGAAEYRPSGFGLWVK